MCAAQTAKPAPWHCFCAHAHCQAPTNHTAPTWNCCCCGACCCCCGCAWACCCCCCCCRLPAAPPGAAPLPPASLPLTLPAATAAVLAPALPPLPLPARLSAMLSSNAPRRRASSSLGCTGTSAAASDAFVLQKSVSRHTRSAVSPTVVRMQDGCARHQQHAPSAAHTHPHTQPASEHPIRTWRRCAAARLRPQPRRGSWRAPWRAWRAPPPRWGSAASWPATTAAPHRSPATCCPRAASCPAGSSAAGRPAVAARRGAQRGAGALAAVGHWCVCLGRLTGR
jgi:hypothetical protein